ncbi:MAG: hypothetical protein D6761_10225 [Candidatus Dadabacteria bacterium]|nr:MAG: hypothetical protein D6761_10225 [Candidatus Dadabacteria bacterium]
MNSISEVVRDPARRQRFIDGCCAVLDAEVEARTGMSGRLVRLAYHQVGKLEGGRLIENVFDKLADEFAEEVDPVYQHWLRETGGDEPFAAWVESHRDELVAALLRVTDRERDRVGKPFLVMTYNRLRGLAERLVGEAIPAVAALVEDHTAA